MHSTLHSSKRLFYTKIGREADENNTNQLLFNRIITESALREIL
jgi:hypothetical protein